MAFGFCQFLAVLGFVALRESPRFFLKASMIPFSDEVGEVWEARHIARNRT